MFTARSFYTLFSNESQRIEYYLIKLRLYFTRVKNDDMKISHTRLYTGSGRTGFF